VCLSSSLNFALMLSHPSRSLLLAAARASARVAYALVGSSHSIRVEDRWIDSQLDRLVVDVNRLLEDFQFGEAEQQIYDFVWTKFCDWYIEIAKVRLRQRLLPSPLPRLLDTLDTTLRLLHPFMPFVTEELWQHLKAYLPDKDQKAASIVIDRYPLADGSRIDVEADRVMESVMEIVRSVRHARAQHRVEPGKRIEAQVYADELLPQLVALETIIEELAQVRPLSILGRGKRQPDDSKALTLVLREAEVVLPWAGMVDRAAERRRLAEETDEARARLVGLEERLSDQAFLSRAPSQVVEKERQKLVALQDRIRRLELELTELGS